MIKSWTTYGVFAVLFLSSCSAYNPISSNNDSISKDQTQVPRNIVKVLNRVTCEDMTCTQENVNKMWQICLSQGWTEKPNLAKVETSRDLKELTSGPTTYEEIVYENIENTETSGIVTSTPSQRTVSKDVTYTGYCIGTEYITS